MQQGICNPEFYGDLVYHQTSRRRAFSKIHQSAIEIVCVCLSQVCKTPMLYIILKMRF